MGILKSICEYISKSMVSSGQLSIIKNPFMTVRNTLATDIGVIALRRVLWDPAILETSGI